MSEKTTHTFLDLTEKPLLGNRLQLLQPKKGYRSAIEPIILAASCEAEKGQKILDVGCGVGTAALCLAVRLKKLKLSIVGIDCQDELIQIAQKNIKLNKLEDKISFLQGDIIKLLPEQLPRGEFHHVITNPPFYTNKEADPSPYKNKHVGHIETTATLKDWIYHCKKFLRSQGTLTVVYTANRFSELIAELVGHNLGAIEIIPLWPRKNVAAKRVLVRARKCRTLSTTLCPGLILHEDKGYTDIAQGILMEGKNL